MTLCQHCRRSHANRPRSLCWSCFYTEGVREQYPSANPMAQGVRGGNEDGGLVAPTRLPLPTGVLPGPGKVAVLAARFAAGEVLYHPLDAAG